MKPEDCLPSSGYAVRLRHHGSRCRGTAFTATKGLETFGHLFPTQEPGPSGQKVAHGVAASVLAIGPGHLLDGHSAGAAINPPHGVAQEHADIPQGHETEKSDAQAVVSGPGFAAFRAPGFAVGPRTDIDHQGRVVLLADDRPPEFSVDETFDRMKSFELDRCLLC